MNFYARQDAARRQTRRLAVLFGMAVIAIVTAVNFVVMTALASGQAEHFMLPTWGWVGENADVTFATSAVVLAIIGLSSLYKSAALRGGGGGVVARGLGGTRIDRTLQDPLRRRLFNVVEEMAIASGVPMPEVYVLEQESGINAFAAGHLPANAAVAVTRGALERLNRAELQGVIAHEFSHVLNGDMRINTRLLALLFGILVIALIGRTVLRHAPVRSSGKKGGGAGAIMLVALALMILGYIGVFFGRLIQAAVARQRETLADASAVQFTREPQGLRNALVKIGALSEGSRLSETDTDEVAHMLFASGMDRMFATHPPLVERIKALDPSFNPKEFVTASLELQTADAADERNLGSESRSRAAAARESSSAAAGLARLAVPLAEVARIAHRVGNPGTAEVEAARAIARALPEELAAGLDSPSRAMGLLLALVMDPKPEARSRQQVIVRERLGDETMSELAAAEQQVKALAPLQRLPFLDQVFPTLRRLPRERRVRIVETLQRLVLVDGRIEIFEYTLATLARLYLRDELNPTAGGGRALVLDECLPELQVLFSTLAHHGAQDEVQARRAYEFGMSQLFPRLRPDYQPTAGWTKALDRAFGILDRLAPPAKEQVVEGVVRTIGHDGQMTVAESELVRVMCAALHCPLPPIVAGAIASGAIPLAT